MHRSTLIFIVSCLSLQSLSQLEVLKQPPIRIKKKKLYLEQEQTILTLDDYGILIDQQLVYDKSIQEDWPCRPQKQQIKFQQPVYKDLITEYSKEQFQKQFIDGQFIGTIPQIIAFEQIENGVAVLTNMGELYIISISRYTNGTLNVKLEDTEILRDLFFTDIYDKTNNRALLIYEYKTKELLLILSNLQMVFEITDHKITKIAQLESLIGEISTEGIARIQNFVCLAQGGYGFRCYKYQKNKLISVYNNTGMFANDLRPIKIDQNNYKLYILDHNQGILVFTASVNQEGDLSIALASFSPIGIRNGITFDVMGNTLMLITKEKSFYYLFDYHLNLTDYTWVELNRWIFQSEIRDIDITHDFAIVTGRSGHHIVYHSIDKKFYQDIYSFVIDHKSQSDLYLPSLMQIDLQSEDLDLPSIHTNVALGITKHRFFAVEWQFNPIQIVCLGENQNLINESPLSMIFNLNSTQCPQKLVKLDDMQMCQTQFQIEVSFKRSIVDKSWLNILMYVTGSIFVAALGTIVIVLYKLILFNNQKKLIQKDLDSLSTEGYKIERNASPSRNIQNFNYIRASLESNNKTPQNVDNLVL